MTGARVLCSQEFFAALTSHKVCCPRPQRRSAALRQQESDRITLVNPLFGTHPAIEQPLSQPANGDLLAICGREPERDRGQCLSDHFHHVVAAGYRRRV
jgi:hypothetical protein